MKIKRNFLHIKSLLPPIPRWKIVAGVLLGLFFSFLFYNFLYLFREAIRILFFPPPLPTNIEPVLLVLPDQIVRHHNLFFGFLSAIFGQSVCFLFWFNLPVGNNPKINLKIKSIRNDLRFLNLFFLHWFSSLAVNLSFVIGGLVLYEAHKPEVFGQYDSVLFLIVVVLFLYTWTTLRRTVKYSAGKIFLSAFILSFIAFGLSSFHPIDTHSINDILLRKNIRAAYKLELPESEYDTYMELPKRRRALIVMPQQERKKDGTSATVFIKFKNQWNDYKLVSLDSVAIALQEWESIDPYRLSRCIVYIDKNVSMRDVIHLKKEMIHADCRRIAYGVIPTNRLYEKEYYTHRCIHLLYSHWYTHPEFRAMMMPSILEQHNLCDIRPLSSSVLSVNGKEITLPDFKGFVKEQIINNPDYAILYYENEDLLFGDYITVMGKIRSAVEELREAYAKLHYHKSYQDLEEEQIEEIMKRYPLRIEEIPPEELSLNHLKKHHEADIADILPIRTDTFLK